MNHIICFSGGESSALVAIEVTRRYPNDNIILLNHDISSEVEDNDIKIFKNNIANYLELPITYKNYNDLDVNNLPNQFDICEERGAFSNPHNKQAICTSLLKTIPFSAYLKKYHQSKTDCIIYYGFDNNEPSRIERRIGILNDMGYKSDYPLALWNKIGIDNYNNYQIKSCIKIHEKVTKTKIQMSSNEFIELYPQYLENISLINYSNIYERTISSVRDINILPPTVYNQFKHANCKGCLKGGQQHWYVVYCVRNDIFERAKLSESRLGYSIIKNYYLKDVEHKFKKMKDIGISADEHTPHQTFWKDAKKFLKEIEQDEIACECFV
jgi:hypothetical protein